MRVLAVERVSGVENPQLEQLPGVVPLVQGVTDVESLVTLEANQIGAERGGRSRRQRGLANPGFALEKERPPQAECQKDRHRETAVRDVVLVGEALLEIGDRAGKNVGTSAGLYNRLLSRTADLSIPR